MAPVAGSHILMACGYKVALLFQMAASLTLLRLLFPYLAKYSYAADLCFSSNISESIQKYCHATDVVSEMRRDDQHTEFCGIVLGK
jgi:hypothetical protein